mmetsp:Transcript_20043/g.55733  ORF Transcript_20043/g.55733 Transcript_20043/m.55733 type:complete len:250 (+) Transcript_20043:2101-2850(+)
MDLVDKDHHLSLGALDLVEDGPQPLLELPPVLGACNEGSKVQSAEAHPLEGLGYVALQDAPGQSLDNRRLSRAGLADQNGIVLGSSRQNLHHPANLLVPSNYRIEPAFLRRFHQVNAVFLQGFVLILGRRRGYFSSPPDLVDRRSGGFLGQTGFGLKGFLYFFLVEFRHEQMIQRNQSIPVGRRRLFGPIQELRQGVRRSGFERCRRLGGSLQQEFLQVSSHNGNVWSTGGLGADPGTDGIVPVKEDHG